VGKEMKFRLINRRKKYDKRYLIDYVMQLVDHGFSQKTERKLYSKMPHLKNIFLFLYKNIEYGKVWDRTTNKHKCVYIFVETHIYRKNPISATAISNILGIPKYRVKQYLFSHPEKFQYSITDIGPMKLRLWEKK